MSAWLRINERVDEQIEVPERGVGSVTLSTNNMVTSVCVGTHKEI